MTEIANPRSCPFPWTGDNGTARQCVERDHCGCDEKELIELMLLADKAILYLTMHHNSSPDYIKGFELAQEYMARRNEMEGL